MGSLFQDVGIGKGIGKRTETLSVWRQHLSNMREQYSLMDDLIVHQDKWNAMEKGIQDLKEFTVLEVIYKGFK